MKKFEEPIVEVTAFEVEDVITTSTTNSTNCTETIDPFA